MATSPESVSQPGMPDGQTPGVNMYDLVPYSVEAYPQTRPDRIAAIAALFGLDSPPPDHCRVLELGCASGGNLIPLALTSPDSAFVGVDFSSRQIGDGLKMVCQLGLNNIELRHASILDVDDDWGLFDYILAHGVYSWVPPDVQDKLLEICGRNLAPSGVAYVSYNTFPGWHARGAIREMLCYHTEHLGDPAERTRAARELLDFLVRSSPRDRGYGALLCEELDVLARSPDSYLAHEHLEDCNAPVYFHQFAERAAAKGLQYLGEAQMGTMLAGRFGPEAENTLRRISHDLLHMEQYMDFLGNRMFRMTLLCHDAVPLDHSLRIEAVKAFHIAAPVKAVSNDFDPRGGKSVEFRGRNGAMFTTRDPLMKAVMACLSTNWPLPMPFGRVLAEGLERLGESSLISSREADTLALRLLNCHVSGLVEFSTAAPAFRTDVSERPIASPYARLRAEMGECVTNNRLESVALGAPSRLILSKLDGSRDRASLVELIGDWLEQSTQHGPTQPGMAPVRERAEQFVDRALDGFARAALLIG